MWGFRVALVLLVILLNPLHAAMGYRLEHCSSNLNKSPPMNWQGVVCTKLFNFPFQKYNLVTCQWRNVKYMDFCRSFYLQELEFAAIPYRKLGQSDKMCGSSVFSPRLIKLAYLNIPSHLLSAILFVEIPPVSHNREQRRNDIAWKSAIKLRVGDSSVGREIHDQMAIHFLHGKLKISPWRVQIAQDDWDLPLLPDGCTGCHCETAELSSSRYFILQKAKKTALAS